jgi:microcompartment protein CcmK/EutM
VIICKVIGQAVSTVKDSRLKGYSLLIVGRMGISPDETLDQFVALDMVGAGEGEIVGVLQGAPAQKSLPVEGVPIDAVVVSIFDSLNVGGKEIHKKA